MMTYTAQNTEIKGTITRDYNSFGDMWTFNVNKINGLLVDFLDYKLSEDNNQDACIAYASSKKELISYLNELESCNKLFLIKNV